MLHRISQHSSQLRGKGILGGATSVLLASAPGFLLGQLNPRFDSVNEPGVGGWGVSIAVSTHDTNDIFMGGDMMGFAHSTDAGKSWQASTGFTNWEMAGQFTFHPSSSSIVWAGTMGG